MKLISVNVGLPREVSWKGKAVRTGIFKEPVNARVMVRELNLDVDGQADLTVHGGLDKAVYVYLMLNGETEPSMQNCALLPNDVVATRTLF